MESTGEIFRGFKWPEPADVFPTGIVDGGVMPAAFQLLFSGLPVASPPPPPSPEEEKKRNLDDLNRLEMRPWTMPARIPAFVTHAAQRMCARHSSTTLAYVGMKAAIDSETLGLTNAQKVFVWEMLTAVDNRFTQAQITQLFEWLRPAMLRIDFDSPDPQVDDLAHVIGVFLFRPVSMEPLVQRTAHVLKYLYVAFVSQLAKLHGQHKHGYATRVDILPIEEQVSRCVLPWMPLVFLIPIPLLDIYSVHRHPGSPKLTVAGKNESERTGVYFENPPSARYFATVIWSAFTRAWRSNVLFTAPFEQSLRRQFETEVAKAYQVKIPAAKPRKKGRQTTGAPPLPPYPYPYPMWPHPMMFGPWPSPPTK